MRESEGAPGLPYPPQNLQRLDPYDLRYNYGDSLYIPQPTPHAPPPPQVYTLPVVSVNYDYLPTQLESPKQLYVDLFEPAPQGLRVGFPVKLKLNEGAIGDIQTQMNPSNPLNSIFEVGDIIGSRVILLPYKRSTWLPTVHAPCDSPFGWGYDTTTLNVSTSMHNPKFGYGTPRAFLIYHPQI